MEMTSWAWPDLCVYGRSGVTNMQNLFQGLFHKCNSDCDLYVIEPNINHLPEDIENISELISYNHAILNCDLIVILVNHKEFLNLNFNDLKTKVLDFSGLTNKF